MVKKRKTRQEKVTADLRRKFELTGELKWEAGNVKLDNEVQSEKEETEKSSLPFPFPASHISPLTSTNYLKKDLTKTATLAILAISLEIVLYFLLG